MPGLILAAFLIGAVLGTRFKVLVLVPTTAVVIIVLAIATTRGGAGAPAALAASALSLAGLQIGYLCGSLARLYVRSNVPEGRLQSTLKAAWARARTGALST